METSLKAVVLAAGKGTRLQTSDCDIPKVMREALGKPLLRYVLDALSFIGKRDIIIVAGYKKDNVIDAFPDYSFAVQTEQLGTGHAVMAAETELLGFDGDILVCYGDMPAIRQSTYTALIAEHTTRGNDCTMLTGTSDIPLPYGRVLRDENGDYLQIIEDRDCTPEQKNISELNIGVYVFRAPLLLPALKELKSDNAQGEFYLTDVPSILRARGARIGICMRELGGEVVGVNTPEQLELIEELLRK